MKSFHWRFLSFFLPLSGAVLALALLLYRQHAATKHRQDESDGRAAVELQSEILETELGAAKSDLLYLSGALALQDCLTRPGAAAKAALEREFSRFLSRKDLYESARFLDENGRERVRAGAERRPERAAALPFFREAFAVESGRVYVSSSGAFAFATPIFDASGRRRGLLVLDGSEENFLRKFDSAAASLPGTLGLLDGDGRGRMGGERRFGEVYPDAWRMIVRGDRGAASTREGLFAFKSIDLARVGFAAGGGASGTLRVVLSVPAPLVARQSRRVQKALFLLCAFIEAVLAALIWFLCRARDARELHRRQLEGSEARLRSLSAGLIETQERERRSLSRDLHDDLGQLLTVACLELEGALRPEGQAGRLDVVRRALESTRVALDRMRDISSRLRPRVLDEIGLKEAVRSLLDDYREKTGIDVREDLRFESSDIPGPAGVHLYRILQEALTNAAKHARTKKVQVSLVSNGGAAALSVKDWGAGLDARPAGPGSLGLLSMRERAELQGGTFSIESSPGHGTEVRVTIPLTAANAGGGA